MRVNGKKIIQRLEALYPTRLAEDWDNVGLQLGSEHRVVERILLCLEVDERVVDEAIAKSCDMIIAHHPLIFKGLKTLSEQTPQGRLIARLIREQMLVYCMHTNYDTAEGGLNDILAGRLALERVKPLNQTHKDKLYKLCVFTPKTHSDLVAKAVYAAGAGQLGNYSDCGFATEGQGTFKPLEGADPAIGSLGHLEVVEEVKLETLVTGQELGGVLEAIHRTHPYETPAYDLCELETPAKTYGLGRLGHLNAPMALDAFIDHVKGAFGIQALRVVNPLAEGRKISKVALVSGAGMDYLSDAKKCGAEVFITGDIKYHEATAAPALDMMLVDVGHFESEVIYKHHLKTVLEEIAKEKDYDFVVEVCEREAPLFVFA